jgi:hypothetical protein
VCQYNIMILIEGIIDSSKLGAHTKLMDSDIRNHLENFVISMKPNFNEIIDV